MFWLLPPAPASPNIGREIHFDEKGAEFEHKLIP